MQLHPKDALEFLHRGDIDGALSIIDKLEYFEDVQACHSLLEKQPSSASVSYLTAHASERLGDNLAAYQSFVAAAEGGIASAYYRAGKIVERNGLPETQGEVSYMDLFVRSAMFGHIWSKLRVLRSKSKESLSKFLIYYTYRFLLSPFLIILYTITSKNRDKVRH